MSLKPKHILFVLSLSLMIGSLSSCKKLVLNLLSQPLTSALWEDRAPGKLCAGGSSTKTISNNELTFDANHMLCIQVEMDATDFEKMRNESRFGPDVRENDGAAAVAVALEYSGQCGVPFPEEYKWYSANVKIDGIELNNIAIRKKGFLGSIFSTAPSLRILTDQNIPNQSIGNTNSITLNNNSEDKSRLTQCLYYKIFELAGYPAPRCNLANVSINNEALGPYCNLEPINKRFLNRDFGNSSGNLYEGQLIDFRKNWMPRWAAKTKNTPNLATSLNSIEDILLIENDDEMLNQLEKVLDINKFINFWALEILLGHSDGYCANRNNFYVYQNPSNVGKIEFIPWGLNYFRPDDSELSNFVGADIPRRLSQIESIREKVTVQLDNLLQTVWDISILNQYLDVWIAQVQSAQNDNTYQESAQEIKKWVAERKFNINAELQNGFPIGSSERTNNCFTNNE